MLLGLAGCAIHFTGLLAGEYTYDEREINSWVLLDGPIFAKIISHGAIFLSYLICTYTVVRQMRNQAFQTASTCSTSDTSSATSSI